MRLQQYPFSVEHISGKSYVVGDALSRIPWHLESTENDNNFIPDDEDSDTEVEDEKCNLEVDEDET